MSQNKSVEEVVDEMPKMVCLQCRGDGYDVIADYNTGEPEQIQCQACHAEMYYTTLDCVRTLLQQERQTSQEREREIVESKDNAYHERDMLVCAVSKLFPAYLARHDEKETEWENDWRWIVYVELPTGQVSWHIHDRERELFNHLQIKTNNWDGHNTEQKYQRLEALESIPLPTLIKTNYEYKI